MKRITLLIAVCTICISCFAIPARRKPFVLTQPDGSSITVRLCGDETMHYYTTIDGTPLVKGADGMYRQATYFEAQNIRSRHAQKLRERNAVRSARTLKRRAASTFVGKKRGLVILVNFNDLKMKATSSQSAFGDLFNKEGYNKNQHIGSVRDYFLAQSYGKLTIDFDVVGPYTVSKKMEYYGQDYNDEEGFDMHPAEMVIEALRMANSDVNYADYDWDGDGEVDQVYVLYAGYNQAHGAEANTIWPHEWDLESAKEYGDGTGPLTLDGVKINTYACSSELIDTSGSVISTIGTAVHEFSHCLGLPDFYDTDEQVNFGMESWSVMDAGSYNGPNDWGEVPAGYTSYERMYAGWLTPTILNEPCAVTDMQPIATNPEAYIVYNEKNKNEYYLLENRQLVGFDSYLYGHGMLVLHVDYDANAWADNTVNNTSSHQRMTIIPADNQFMTGRQGQYTYATARDLAGDPYPGTSGNKALTDTSTPAATLYTANADGRRYMGKPIEDITESNNLISFKFMGGVQIDSPEVLDATDITSAGFTANWTAVDGADAYEIELQYTDGSTSAENVLLLSEDFSGFADVSKDGTLDISGILDSYMQTAGWNGVKCFVSTGRLKIGSSKHQGYLTTPQMDAPKSGTVTVVLSEQKYGTSAAEISLTIQDESNRQMATQSVTAGDTRHIVTFGSVAGRFSLKIQGAARFYITAVCIYDGALTAEDLANGTATNVHVVSFTITDTSYTFADLQPGIDYKYHVRTVQGASYSPWSDWVSMRLPSDETIDEDVNHDGVVDTQDVLDIYELMQTTSVGDAAVAKDVNGDGIIDTQDVLCIYKIMQEK